MTDILTPFEPASTGVVPETPKKPEKAKRKAATNGRRKRTVKAVNEVKEAVEAPPRKRKARAVASVRKPRSMKLPVDTMLAALSQLKGDDGALFEKLLGILNAAGKPQRSRVMAALAKVFE